MPGLLPDEHPEDASDREQGKRKPHEERGECWRVRDPPVQMRGSGLPVRGAQHAARAVNVWPGHAAAGESDARLRRHFDAVASEAGAHAEIEGVVVARVRGVEAAELVPDVTANEHADGPYAEHILEVVVLLLIEFLAAQQPTRSGGRKALPELDDAFGVIPIDELRAGGQRPTARAAHSTGCVRALRARGTSPPRAARSTLLPGSGPVRPR